MRPTSGRRFFATASIAQNGLFGAIQDSVDRYADPTLLLPYRTPRRSGGREIHWDRQVSRSAKTARSAHYGQSLVLVLVLV